MVFGYTKAQLYIGAEAGYSNNYSNTDISSTVLTKNQNGGGYTAGIVTKYEYKKGISIKSGIFLLQKNYFFLRTGDYTGVYTGFKNTYIQVPATIQIKLLSRKKIEAYISAGGFGGYWAFGKIYGAMPNIFSSYENRIDNSGQGAQYLSLTKYSEKYQFNTIKDNRIELGSILGIGANFSLKGKCLAFVECKYFHSLTDQQKKYMLFQTKKFNQTISVSLGILYNLTRKIP